MFSFFHASRLVVMYETNNEIARAILKGKEQNDVYCGGIVHYPLRKS